MTTGSDPARVDPDHQPAAVDTGIQPAATVTADPDDLELEQLRTAAKAEETAGQGQSGEGEGGATPAAAPTPQPDQPRAPAPMIPKARLDEVLRQKEQSELEAAYWRGQAEARQTPQAPAPGSPQQQQPAPVDGPEQKLAGIHARQDQLAKQFDDGEITLADFTRQNRELTNEELVLREEQLVAKVRPAAPAQGQADELYLETMTAKLEEEHPWVQVFDQVGTKSDWAYLKTRAIENLTERNIDPSKGSMGKFELRREMAKLADELGPSLVAQRAKASGIAIPGQPAAAPAAGTQRPNLSPAAQARAAKLNMAADAPPDVTSMTSSGTDIGYTAAQLEGMSDEDIANLPASVKAKILSSA